MSFGTNQDSNEIVHDSMEADYGDDILYAGWNPEVDSVSQQLQLVPAIEQQDKSAVLTTKVAELFLRKMYSFQR
jgi:hypothetical protein